MRLILCTVLVLSGIMNLQAWGPTGHRVIGEVADHHLSKKARKEVKALLGHQSLAEVSTWMDEIRSDDRYNYTHSWHYTTIPDGLNYDSRNNDQGQLVERIDLMISTLKSADSSTESKVQALKFLVHLVGDLHQPLHVGNGEDRGGNDVKVRFFYEDSNLHRVWDSGMIDHKLYSYTELAAIIDHTSEDQVSTWLEGSAATWAEECMQYRDQVYDTGDPDRMGYEYVYHNWALVEQQLLKAGVRLAGILNGIYS
jgi:hypothetical protein